MKKPDVQEMRRQLAINQDPIAEEYILDKMTRDEVFFQYIKNFGSKLPLKAV